MHRCAQVCTGVHTGVRRCAQVCAGVRRCAQVCAGVRRCAQVCAGCRQLFRYQCEYRRLCIWMDAFAAKKPVRCFSPVMANHCLQSRWLHRTLLCVCVCLLPPRYKPRKCKVSNRCDGRSRRRQFCPGRWFRQRDGSGTLATTTGLRL